MPTVNESPRVIKMLNLLTGRLIVEKLASMHRLIDETNISEQLMKMGVTLESQNTYVT